MPNLNHLISAGFTSMTPNPYQSPRDAGYDAPRPGLSPLPRRIVAVFPVSVTVGWVGLFAIVVAVDCLRWQLGF